MKKANYQKLINQEGKLVFVDFYADWCGPCQQMMPSITKLAKEFGSKLSVNKVNIDKNPALATSLQIRSVPSLLLYRDGKIIWRQSGAMTFNQLKSEIEIFVNR